MKALLFIAFCVITTFKVHAQDPEIVDEIWPEVKPVGHTARLNCTVVNKANNVVWWEHVNSSQTISKDEVIDINNDIIGGLRKYEVNVRRSEDRITYMLIIRRLREQNAGHYRCKVRIQGLTNPVEWPSKVGILTVQVAPTIRPGSSNVRIVDEMSSTHLECLATGIPYPNITWVRSDGGWLPSGFAQSRGYKLHLVNITVSMGGVYRCVADNNIRPPAHHLAEVLVFSSPVVRVIQDTVGQAPGGRYNAKLECIVRGYPAPTVRWEKAVKGGRIEMSDHDRSEISKQTNDNQNLMAHEQWYTLKIKNVESNDYTDYFCIATNTKGSSTASIALFETTECQGPDCPSMPSSKAHFTTFSVFTIVVATAAQCLYTRSILL